MESGVEDVGWEDTTPIDSDDDPTIDIDMIVPGDYPDQGEDNKDNVTTFPVVDVTEDLGKFKNMVGAVVNYEDKCTNTGEVG